MRYIILILCSLSCKFIYAQINFGNNTIDSALYKKALSADSAIMLGEFGEIHSFLIIKDGNLVFENYYNNWPKDSVHQLQSATKSIISTLLGCAIQEKFVESVEEPIAKFFPEYYFNDSLKKQIKISDLLTQQHGLNWMEGAWDDPKNNWRKVISEEGDWYKNILETPLDTIPGTKFVYSNAAPVLISGIIQNTSKINIDSFAIKYLFDPLQIKDFWFWQGNGGPKNNGLALISLTSRDMAKLGQLYLQNGKWGDQQIIPEYFAQSATSSIIKGVEPNGLYKQYDYGYFWWSNPISRNDKNTNVYLARGAGGQNIIVNKKDNVIVIITAWNMQQPNKPQLIYDLFIAE